MVRVSSFGQQQLLLQGIFQNQNSLAEAQRQITTGKRTDEFRGLAGETSTVLGTRSFRARIETYQETIATVRGRLDANDVQLGGIIEALEALKENIQVGLANRQAAGFEPLLGTTFSFAINSLNSNLDGSFLFSGARTGLAPVNVASLPELQTLSGVTTPTATTADIEGAFDNASEAFRARIADNVDIEFGLLADDVATEAFTVLLNLYNFTNSAAGPLDGELDQTQFDFFQAQLGELDNAITGIREQQVRNGLIFQRLDVADEQLTDTNLFLETFISDLEEVDIAEAITRLENDQLALQVSYQAVATLNQLSLLNFL